MAKIILLLWLAAVAAKGQSPELSYKDWILILNPGVPAVPFYPALMRMYADSYTNEFGCNNTITNTRCVYDGGGVAVSKVASYATSGTDVGELLTFNCSSACTLTLPNSGALMIPPYQQWWIDVQNRGTAALSIDPNGLSIDGSSTPITIGQNQGLRIETDNVNYFTQRGVGSGVTFETNGTSNSSQTLLNLKSGTGISVTNTSGGDVQFSLTGTGAAHTLGMSWGISGGTSLATGTSYAPVTFACTIGSKWFADSDGTVTFDVLVGGFSITASAQPSASGGTNSGNTTSWTTSISGSSTSAVWLGWKISSISGATYASVGVSCQ